MSETEWIEGTPTRITWYKTLSVRLCTKPLWWLGNRLSWWAYGPCGPRYCGSEITHYAPLLFDPPPQPPKSDLGIVCEWLWPEGVPCTQPVADGAGVGWAVLPPDVEYDEWAKEDANAAVLWHIETEVLRKFSWSIRWDPEHGHPWHAIIRYGVQECHDIYGQTRGEALLKAALWMKRASRASR